MWWVNQFSIMSTACLHLGGGSGLGESGPAGGDQVWGGQVWGGSGPRGVRSKGGQVWGGQIWGGSGPRGGGQVQGGVRSSQGGQVWGGQPGGSGLAGGVRSGPARGVRSSQGGQLGGGVRTVPCDLPSMQLWCYLLDVSAPTELSCELLLIYSPMEFWVMLQSIMGVWKKKIAKHHGSLKKKIMGCFKQNIMGWWHPPLWTDRRTDTCQNITFPHPSDAGGNKQVLFLCNVSKWSESLSKPQTSRATIVRSQTDLLKRYVWICRRTIQFTLVYFLCDHFAEIVDQDVDTETKFHSTLF